MYRALYRKWRPQRFADVVGQAPIVTALQNQIAAGRIAPEDCPRVGFLGVDSVADEFGNPCCEGCGDSEGVRDGACATDAEGGR